MSALIDLTGQRFGRLTVLGRAEHNTSGGKARWVCRCDCGRKTTVTRSNLKSGNTKSCGCLRALHGASTLIDLSGRRFGKLTVLRRAKKNCPSGGTSWVCRCDCGRTTVIAGGNLKKQQACGSCRKERNWKLIDLTGQQFGRLTVIGRVKDKDRRSGTPWRCQCACGRHTVARSADLRNNRHQSCGCHGAGPQSLIDLTGNRFGKLTVLGRSLSKPAHRTRAYWKCRCDCGRLTVAWGADLRRQRKVSCGRCRGRDQFGRFVASEPGNSEAIVMPAACHDNRTDVSRNDMNEPSLPQQPYPVYIIQPPDQPIPVRNVAPPPEMRPDAPTAEYCLLSDRRVRWEGETPEPLTGLEFRLLSFLLRATRYPIPLWDVGENVWGHDQDRKQKTIANAIYRLNDKLLQIKFPWIWTAPEREVLREDNRPPSPKNPAPRGTGAG